MKTTEVKEARASAITAEERRAMQDSVRRLLTARSTEADVRKVIETEMGYDPKLWSDLAALGVVGLTIGHEFGGIGGGPLELELVMEEAGASLLCGPLLASVVAAALIEGSGDRAAKNRLLPRVADGTLIATVGLTGDVGTWDRSGVCVQAEAQGGGWQLNGHASFVLHGQNAAAFIMAAATEDGFGLFEIERGTTGLGVRTLPVFDRTQPLARLTFENAPARRLGTAGWNAVEKAMHLALVARAGDQVGGAQKILAMTVEYAKTRVQFGRAIGSFQAIKHMAADLLLETESAVSAARNAAQSLAEDAPDARAAVSLAAFACADAYSKVTADAIQMHGGIAFTWAHPAHLYLRRARADAQLFGNSALHRESYLNALGA